MRRASFCQQILSLLQKSRLCLQSKDDKVLRKLFLNGFLLRDRLSGKVDFRPIVAFHLISRVPPGIDPHLLVHYERHRKVQIALIAFLLKAPCRGSGHTEIWEAGKEEVSRTEEKQGFLLKRGNVIFSLGMSGLVVPPGVRFSLKWLSGMGAVRLEPWSMSTLRT